MKWISIVLFLAGFSLTQHAQEFTYWNELTDAEKRQELAKPTTSKSIAAFYFGEQPAGDSISLDALLTELSKADSGQRLFYFEVFRTKMPSYRDSLAINNYTIHVMNLLTYHAPYVLHYLATHHDPACHKMLERAADHAFENMSWFFPPRARFRSELARDLNARQQQQLDKILK